LQNSEGDNSLLLRNDRILCGSSTAAGLWDSTALNHVRISAYSNTTNRFATITLSFSYILLPVCHSYSIAYNDLLMSTFMQDV
ncbi:hypothetical protein PDJAM_G00009300, partial [Pangasius djambal]|nr:hypothetical protein [Pangasius djambal]